MSTKHSSTPGPWEAEPAPEPWFENHVWSSGGRLQGAHVANVTRGEDLALIAAAPELRDALAAALDCLLRVGCQFWACEGPDAPFEDMKTCFRCERVQESRALLARLDGGL